MGRWNRDRVTSKKVTEKDKQLREAVKRTQERLEAEKAIQTQTVEETEYTSLAEILQNKKIGRGKYYGEEKRLVEPDLTIEINLLRYQLAELSKELQIKCSYIKILEEQNIELRRKHESKEKVISWLKSEGLWHH